MRKEHKLVLRDTSPVYPLWYYVKPVDSFTIWKEFDLAKLQPIQAHTVAEAGLRTYLSSLPPLFDPHALLRARTPLRMLQRTYLITFDFVIKFGVPYTKPSLETLACSSDRDREDRLLSICSGCEWVLPPLTEAHDAVRQHPFSSIFLACHCMCTKKNGQAFTK